MADVSLSEEFCFLDYNAMQSTESKPKFLGNMSPLSSEETSLKEAASGVNTALYP
jgi:hypothetical protein